MDFNAPFSSLSTCREPLNINMSQVAITMDYRHQGRVRLCHIMGMLLVINRVVGSEPVSKRPIL